MARMIQIDADDIDGLSAALTSALMRKGVVFNLNNPIRDYDYPEEEEEIPDVEPYFGIMPNAPRKSHFDSRDNDDWLFQESGGIRYGSGGCGGGHCGGGGRRSFGYCGGGGC